MTDQESRHSVEIEEMSFASPLFLNIPVPHDPSTTCRNHRAPLFNLFRSIHYDPLLLLRHEQYII